MIKVKKSNLLILMSGLVLSTLFVGCGGSDASKVETAPGAPSGDSAPQQPAAPAAATSANSLQACQANYKRIGNSDCMPVAYFSNFSYACSVAGGTIVTGNLCKIEIQPSSNINLVTALNRLTYSQPQHSSAFKPLYLSYQQHPIVIFTNDKVQLTYVNSTSGWGGPVSSTSTVLGIPFTTWTNDCNQTSVTGIANGSQLTNEGQAAGLVISNGTQVQKFDTQGTVRTFTSTGDFRLGFNVADGTGSCQELKFKFKHTHCEDSNGNSVSCP